MIRIVFTVTILLLSASSGWTKELGLAETVRLATGHSLELKKARLASLAAQSQYAAAAARRFPTLSVDSKAMLISDVPSFTIELPLGQSLDRELGSKEVYQTDIALALPLYAGGRISSGVEAGKALVAINDALERADLNQVTLLAQVGYLALYRADQVAVSAQAALDRATITQETVQSMFDAGAADSVDLLESELTVTDARLAWRETLSNRRQQEIRLLILLGLELSESIAIADTFAVPAAELPKLPVASDKPELAAANATIDFRKAGYRASRSGYLPTISLVGGYSFGKPNRDQFNGEFDDYFSVGARAQWSFNLGNETGKQTTTARLDWQGAEIQQQQVGEQLDREAALAYEQLLLARDRYETAWDRATLAARNYRLATARHTDGALATNRLLEIEQTLAAAEAGRAAAVADYFIVRSNYLYAIGSDLTQEGN
jgi:outer membrane protein TolC